MPPPPPPYLSRRRWSPTPHQLMILKELYQRGLTNPSASQIQRITALLSSYGDVQGKNVFYWFQNHKARHRQKIRMRIAMQGTGDCNDQRWRAADPWKDGTIRMDGRVSAMMADTCPIFLCCCNKPQETLELFPLTSLQ